MDVIAEIFQTYGWGGIIGLVLIVAIFVCGQWLSNKLSNDMSTGLEKVGEKLTNQMSKQNDQLLNTIVSQQDKLLDHLLDKEQQVKVIHNEMLSDKIKLAEEINSGLKEIMISHHAQRAFIIEFHNTNSNLSGIPFAKYSCTYEWFDKGVFALSNRCQALPFSQMAKIVGDVIHTDKQIKVYNDMHKFADENPSLWSALSIENSSPHAVIYSAMYDKNNILIGMLCLEYQKEHKITDEEINQLTVETAQMTSIINIRYKYSE